MKVRIGNSSIQIRERCNNCPDTVFGQAHKHAKFTAEQLAAMATLDWTSATPPCVVCGARGTELHHWAPRHLFGEEADLWPTANLCPACHTRWHTTVEGART